MYLGISSFEFNKYQLQDLKSYITCRDRAFQTELLITPKYTELLSYNSISDSSDIRYADELPLKLDFS